MVFGKHTVRAPKRTVESGSLLSPSRPERSLFSEFPGQGYGTELSGNEERDVVKLLSYNKQFALKMDYFGS